MPKSLLPFEPNPDGTCRACRGALNPETGLCVRCGAAHGERNRCPHCRTIARTLPHPTLLHCCSVCGKPRLSPGPATMVTDERATMHLRAAGQSQTVSTILRILSYVMLGLGLPGLLLTALVLLILMPGLWVSGIALTFAVIPLLLWLFLRSRDKATLLERDRALESAYSQAILGVLRSSPLERDAAAIAQAIALDLGQTERLLSKLNADERMTSRVTDDGDLVFGVAEPARVRIADTADSASQTIVEAELDEQSAVDQSLQNRT